MSTQAPPDPLSKLTKAEKKLVKKIDQTWTREAALARLKADLQTAVEIELATIPIYLFTYYSIIRNAHTGNNIRVADQFANKAGAAIMSVAVEEMLHMSLSSNILFSLGVEPQLYMKAPSPYPSGLPYHNPKGPPGPKGDTQVKIPLAKLSYEQLWHFLQIEYPETTDAEPQDSNWDTIGQFYSYIRCLICSKHITDDDFKQGDAKRQIQHFNYSPNNIDTVHPSGPFDPWKPAPPGDDPKWTKANPYQSAAQVAQFDNAEDSFAAETGEIEATPLISIANKIEALTAIDTICDQGEGYANPNDGETDDPSGEEASHYWKFLTLQAQFAQYENHTEELPKYPAPPPQIPPVMTEAFLDQVIVNFPENPTTASYTDEKHVALSNFCNGLFQYMFIMTETMYRIEPDPKFQKWFFNVGLHRSMIWILDKLIQNMRRIELPTPDGQPTQYLAPTFENISLGDRAHAFANLTALGNKVIKLWGPESSQADLVDKALTFSDTTPDGKTHSMHLPDVSEYWK